MYCQKCGTQNRDGSTFCVGCGSPLYATSPVNDPWNPPAPVISPAGTGADFGQKVHATLKTLATSPLLIIAAICYTLTVVLNLVVANTAFDLSAYYDLLHEMGVSYSDIQSLMSGSESGFTIGTVIGMIPSILIATGMWITIASGAGREAKPITTAGLTIIQVIQIISTVFGCLISALLLFAVIVLGVFAAEMPEAAMFVMVILGIVIVLVAGFMIFYNVMVISTIGKIKNTIRTGVPNHKVSMFVAVMCIIAGSFSALGIFGVFATPGSVIVNLLSLVSAALCPILTGCLLITYRNRMRALEYECQGAAPAAPAYGGYGYPYPAPPVAQYIPPQSTPPMAPPPSPENFYEE